MTHAELLYALVSIRTLVDTAPGGKWVLIDDGRIGYSPPLSPFRIYVYTVKPHRTPVVVEQVATVTDTSIRWTPISDADAALRLVERLLRLLAGEEVTP